MLPENYASIYEKRGDNAWAIDGVEITEVVITNVSLNDEGFPIIECGYMDDRWVIEGGEPIEKDVLVDCSRPISEIGKTIFLTREEAEAALEQQKGDKND